MRANLAQREPEKESYRVSTRVDRYFHASACCPCDKPAGLVLDIALDVPHGATCSHNPGLGSQGCLSNGTEKVDLQLDGCERLALSQRSGVGVPHRRISQVAVDATVQRAHWVVVPFVGLQLKDRMARFNGLQDEPKQAGNRRRG